MQGEIHAAGAVLWRDAGAGAEVALVHRPRYGDWSFPKGKQASGEHILLTAVREVFEETGVRAALGRRLPSVRYQRNGRPKLVHYWAARPASTTPFTPSSEIDQCEWLTVRAARERLSYSHDAGLLAEFLAGPAGTVPLIFLRHAAATSKTRWRAAGHADDLSRPLSGQGLEHAQALAQILASYQTAHVVSSGAERCLGTVRPYGALTGAAIETGPGLTVGDPAGEAVTTGRWAGDIAASEKPVIVCAHRENLPALIAGACQQLGTPVPESPPLRPGDFLALQVSAGRVVSAEQHQVSP